MHRSNSKMNQVITLLATTVAMALAMSVPSRNMSPLLKQYYRQLELRKGINL